MGGHTVTKSNNDMADTVAESDSDATDNKPQAPSKLVINPCIYMTSKIKLSFANLGVVMKTGVGELLKIA